MGPQLSQGWEMECGVLDFCCMCFTAGIETPCSLWLEAGGGHICEKIIIHQTYSQMVLLFHGTRLWCNCIMQLGWSLLMKGSTGYVWVQVLLMVLFIYLFRYLGCPSLQAGLRVAYNAIKTLLRCPTVKLPFKTSEASRLIQLMTIICYWYHDFIGEGSWRWGGSVCQTVW